MNRGGAPRCFHPGSFWFRPVPFHGLVACASRPGQALRAFPGPALPGRSASRTGRGRSAPVRSRWCRRASLPVPGRPGSEAPPGAWAAERPTSRPRGGPRRGSTARAGREAPSPGYEPVRSAPRPFPHRVQAAKPPGPDPDPKRVRTGPGPDPAAKPQWVSFSVLRVGGLRGSLSCALLESCRDVFRCWCWDVGVWVCVCGGTLCWCDVLCPCLLWWDMC